jgi:hypothetical protein
MAVDQERGEGSARGGMSRRDMIKAAGVAGVAAWTAPVIIDSLSSPAAAGSVCNKYWVKVTPAGACFSAVPGDLTMFPISDAKWAGSCADPGGDISGGNPHMPSSVASGTPYTVTLGANCTFDATRTGWTIGGRYHKDNGADTYSFGTAADGSSTGTVSATGDGGRTLAYIYLKFCCTTA